MLTPQIDTPRRPIKRYMTERENSPPVSENKNPVSPPEKKPVKKHRATIIPIAGRMPSQYNTQMVTTLAKPSLMPGNGTQRKSGINRSKTESPAANAVSRPP